MIDWRSTNCNLKACFPLTASNAKATYNWDVGTIQRPTETPRQFEVASHQWIDLTDQSGSYGATVLTDCKNGSDKPDDHTVRLTLIRTPGTRGRLSRPGGRRTSDIMSWSSAWPGHAGDWRQGQTDWQGQRLNQPLLAFASAKHAGALGKSFSLVNLSTSRVRVLALKKAEESDEFIIRLVELDGKANAGVEIGFAAPVAAAREVNGQEQTDRPGGDRGWETAGGFYGVSAADVRGETGRAGGKIGGGEIGAGGAEVPRGRFRACTARRR